MTLTTITILHRPVIITAISISSIGIMLITNCYPAYPHYSHFNYDKVVIQILTTEIIVRIVRIVVKQQQ